MRNELHHMLQNMRRSLAMIGFSEEAVEGQLKDLNDLIFVRILDRIRVDKHLEVANFQPEIFEKVLDGNLSREEAAEIIKEESLKTIEEYFSHITQNLPEEDKNKFYHYLSS